MHVIAERRIRFNSVDNSFCEIARMRRGESHSPDPGDAPNVIEQHREVPTGGRRITVTVHVLSQELNLAVACPRQLASFRNDRSAGAAALRTASERNYAVRASLIAPFNNGDVSAMRIIAPGHWRVERFVRIQAQSGDALVAGFKLHQQFRQLVVARRPAHHAHMRSLLENLLAFLLGNTPEHGERLALALFALELLEAV